jgi:hypothetical protein
MSGCCCNIGLRRRACLVVAVLLSLAGCGDTSNRLPLAGTVTWQGRPLVKGSILFVPTADHKGPKVGAPIVNGDYEINKDRGATPGTYRVEVRADAGEYPHAPTDLPRPKAPPPQLVIPAEYNRQSKLTAVVSRDQTRFDFNLPLPIQSQ